MTKIPLQYKLTTIEHIQHYIVQQLWFHCNKEILIKPSQQE